MQPVPAHQSAMAKATAERNIVRVLGLGFIGSILAPRARLVEQNPVAHKGPEVIQITCCNNRFFDQCGSAWPPRTTRTEPGALLAP